MEVIVVWLFDVLLRCSALCIAVDFKACHILSAGLLSVGVFERNFVNTTDMQVNTKTDIYAD